MKTNISPLVVYLLFVSSPVLAQGFGEYGRMLEGMGQKNSVIPKVITPAPEDRGNVKQRSLDSSSIKNNLMPAALIVEVDEAVLYARSEDWADKIMQLPRGAKLVPMVQATGASAWYMVKTQTGTVGWIKSSDVSPVRE